ncbi:hypothetical protein ACFWPX_20855 [Nocardia sp. NPDC058518]
MHVRLGGGETVEDGADREHIADAVVVDGGCPALLGVLPRR